MHMMGPGPHRIRDLDDSDDDHRVERGERVAVETGAIRYSTRQLYDMRG